MFESPDDASIVRAEFIEQRVEAGVVARLQEVHEFVRDHELQAFGRIGGKARVDADGTGLWRA